MPTQRPFFANFFSAFRARSSPTFQAKSSTTTGAITPSILSASAHVSTTIATATSASGPRNITTKAVSDTSAQGNHAATISQPIKTGAPSPFGATTLTSGSPGTTFYRRPPSPSPHGHNLALSPPGHSNPIARGRQRRDSGSSNSSGGFMDAMGSEKWYVGGRTATGEERFYQLSLVSGSDGKRVRSLDRLSL